MREYIQFENFEVEIWRRPRQSRMYLTVREDGRVRVTCNRGVPRAQVLGFVARNRPFIAATRPPPPPQFLTGDQLWLFGRRVTLEVTWTWAKHARLEVGAERLDLIVPVGASRAERAAAVVGEFRRRGAEHLTARAAELAARTGLRPSGVTVRGQKARWGSCSDRRAVSLNWKLVAAPPAVIDYVIFHELAHLEHMDHSRAFWALVARIDPEWKGSRAWLREHQREVHAQFAQSVGNER